MQFATLVVLVGLMNREGGTEPARALLAACNASLVYGRCELEGSAEEPEAVRAQVLWLDGDLGADIQVFLGTPPLQRTLHFKQEDPLVERWRAVGLIIATLTEVRRTEMVSAQTAEDVQPPVEEAPVEPTPAEPTPADLRQTPPALTVVPPPMPVPSVPPAAAPGSSGWARWWELGATASPALGGARGQLGVWAGFRQQLGALPMLGVLEASWASGLERPGGVELRMISGSAGVGAFLARDGWQPRVRAELLGERRSASVVDDATGERGEGARTVIGGRVGADFLYGTWSRLGLLLGADATVSARTVIRVHDEPVTSLPAFRIALRAGVTLGP
jgi:hypothetical protein